MDDTSPDLSVHELTPQLQADLANRFTYHAPKPSQIPKYGIVRNEARRLAELLCKLCPDSRERAVALTNLETAVFWANAAIARNE